MPFWEVALHELAIHPVKRQSKSIDAFFRLRIGRQPEHSPLSHSLTADFVRQVIRFCRAVSILSCQQSSSLKTNASLHQHSQRERLPGSGGLLNEKRCRRGRPLSGRSGGPDQVRELMIVERFAIDLATITTDFAKERPEFASQVTVKFRCRDEPLRNEVNSACCAGRHPEKRNLFAAG